MTETTQIHAGVRDRLDAPEAGRQVSLIVGVVDGSSEEVLDQVRDTGAEIEDELFYDSLAVSIDESQLDALCSLDVVTSVEIEGEWEQMDSGNFPTLGSLP